MLNVLITCSWSRPSAYFYLFLLLLSSSMGAGCQAPLLLLTETPSSVNYGVSTSLSAFISPAPASGLVTFTDPVVGTLGQSVPIGGNATLGTPTLPVGSYQITARYSSNASNGPLTSAPVALTISPAMPSMVLFPKTQTPTLGSPASFAVSLFAAAKPAVPVVHQNLSPDVNSTTDFMGDSIFAWWPMPLHNDGVVGETAAKMLLRFRSQVSGHGYERVILLAGTNDILQTANDPATTLQSIKSMADLASSAGIQIVLCTIPDIVYNGVDLSARVLPLNAAIVDFATKNQYTLIDFHAALAGHPEWLSDGIHPTPAGYDVMEYAVAQTLLFPTGSVSLADGTSATLSSTGTAILSTASLPFGAQTLTATYSGDLNFLASSASTDLVVAQAPTATSLSVQTLKNETVTSAILTATVTHPSGIDASGLVTFFDGTTALGSSSLAPVGSATFTTGNLAGGAHTFTAAYAGNLKLAPSTSPAADLSAQFFSTIVSISAPSTSFFAGDPITLTVNISPASGLGLVRFMDGAQILLQTPISSGGATFTTSLLTSGIHRVAASYSNDNFITSIQSSPLSLTINHSSIAIALRPIPAIVVFGSLNTMTATVTPPAATGTVLFRDIFSSQGQTVSQVLGSSAIVNGAAILDVTSLHVGTHSIVAAYSGDSRYPAAESTANAIRVDPAGSTTSLAPLPSSLAYGATTLLSASVSPLDAAGTITFVDKLSGVLAQVTLSNGSASFSTAALTPGSHTLSAVYAGDDAHASSASRSLTIEIAPAVSSISIVSLSGTAIAGSSAFLSAVVSPLSATGAIFFRDSITGLLGQATLNHGTAILPLNLLSVGTYLISATYSGDPFYAPSVSPVTSMQIVRNSTTITLRPVASVAPFGTGLMLAASISPALPSGLVNFYDTGARLLGSALVVNGTATLINPQLTIGVHSISADFIGDDLNSPSHSFPVTTEIVAGTTATTLALAQNAVQAGASVVLNVRVTSATYSSPGGIVVIRSGAKLLASAPLLYTTAGVAYASPSIDSASLGVGSFPLVALYSGDSANVPSDSSANSVVLTIQPVPTAIRLTLSASRVFAGTPGTLSALVSTPNASIVPTGLFTFFSNGIAFATAPVDASGSGLATLPSMVHGLYALSATYQASGLYANASAPSQLLTVTLPVALELTPASIEMTPGSSRTSTLIIFPLSGYNGPISARCISPVLYLGCTVVIPAHVSATEPLSAMVQVTVPPTTALLPVSAAVPLLKVIPTLALALLLPLFRIRSQSRSRTTSRIAPLRLLGMLLLLAGLSGVLSGCTLGGHFFDVPAGPQKITVQVNAGGTLVTTELAVNIVR